MKKSFKHFSDELFADLRKNLCHFLLSKLSELESRIHMLFFKHALKYQGELKGGNITIMQEDEVLSFILETSELGDTYVKDIQRTFKQKEK